MFWVILLVIAIMIIAAITVLFSENYLIAVMASSIVSLTLSVLFVFLQAPDVALAEAVVGAGLSGVIFAITLRKIGLWK
jgi:uncharacterized MnhB-related membrane protein